MRDSNENVLIHPTFRRSRPIALSSASFDASSHPPHPFDCRFSPASITRLWERNHREVVRDQASYVLKDET